jgi:hypothetical protein
MACLHVIVTKWFQTRNRHTDRWLRGRPTRDQRFSRNATLSSFCVTRFLLAASGGMDNGRMADQPLDNFQAQQGLDRAA